MGNYLGFYITWRFKIPLRVPIGSCKGFVKGLGFRV